MNHRAINFKTQPIWNYFRFSTLYALKKKSTWLAPAIFSVIFIVIAAIIGNFTGEPQATNLRMFMSISALFSIVFFAIVGIVKGLNIFQDPASEGIEILIVSKPIERWQVVLVKFLVFHLLGLIYLFSAMIVYSICAAILGLNPNQITFNQIAIGSPLTNWFAYMLLGTIAILLALKLNSKTILSIGVVTMMALSAADTFVNSFSDMFITTKASAIKNEILGQNSSPFAPSPFNTIRDQNGNLIPFIATSPSGMIKNIKAPTSRQFDLSLMYDQDKAKQLENIWNQAPDNTWVNQLVTFLNPVSAFNKLANLGHYQPQSDSARSQNDLNENDFSFQPEIKAANDISQWDDHVLQGLDLTNNNYQIFQFGNADQSYYFVDGNSESTTDWIAILNDESVKKPILELIDKELADLNNATTSEQVIGLIETKLANLGQFNWQQFGSLTLMTKTTNQNGITVETEIKNWISNANHQAAMIFYLGQIYLTNVIFDQKNENTLTSTNSNHQFYQAVEKGLLDLDQIQPPAPGQRPPVINSGFFGQTTMQQIIKKADAQFVQLVPSQSTPTWALVLTWTTIMLALSAGAIALYFREDFK